MIQLVARKDVIWNRRKKPAERVEILLGRVVVVLGWVGEKELLSRPCNGDIEEAAFFFEGLLFMPTSDWRKLSIEDPDDEDYVPFQAFGAVDCGEYEVVIGVCMFAARGGRGVQGEVFQERRQTGRLSCEVAGWFQVFDPDFGICRIIAFEDRFVMLDYEGETIG